MSGDVCEQYVQWGNVRGETVRLEKRPYPREGLQVPMCISYDMSHPG